MEGPLRFWLSLLFVMWCPGVLLAQQNDLCGDNTYRCHPLPDCIVDGVAKMCAYGSSSATTGALKFRGGYLGIDWMDDDTVLVTFGDTKRQTIAKVTRDEDGTLYTLRDGEIKTIFIPSKWPE